MTDLVTAIKFAREGAGVKRCHTIPIIGEYLNGHHSFNMLAMLRIWRPDASLKLVWAIIEHDLPERLTGDVPAPAKWSGEFIDGDKLAELEGRIIEGYFGDDNHAKLSLSDYSWLKALDILELYLWCRDQIQLGNRNVLGMMDRIDLYVHRNRASWPKEFNEQWTSFMKHDWDLIPELGDDQ